MSMTLYAKPKAGGVAIGKSSLRDKLQEVFGGSFPRAMAETDLPLLNAMYVAAEGDHKMQIKKLIVMIEKHGPCELTEEY